MSYEQHLTEDRRLVILRLLEEAQGYSLNESLVHDLLGRFAHTVSRDRLRSDLAWLKEQELVTVETIAGSVQVATLTRRGGDVAHGRVTVPGVKRPGPRD